MGPGLRQPVDDDGNPYNLVFTRENGSLSDPGGTCLTFVKLVKDAGLSHLKLHGLRHFNISLQLDADRPTGTPSVSSGSGPSRPQQHWYPEG